MNTTQLKKWQAAALAAVFLLPATPSHAEITLNGAGATFPYPIYSKWFDEYHNEHPEIQINYQSIGSGGGIRQFTANMIDFGATDGPMNDQQLSAVSGKCFHIPTVMGAAVPAFNVPGVTDLKFTGEVLANIFLGNIKNWDDKAIQQLNPDVKLPNAMITIVRRSDGSGTTYCWTDYLSKVSAEWKSKVGMGVSVNWPVGLGAKGNEGVTAILKQTQNSLGYIELAYAKENRLAYGSVQNPAGEFIKADLPSIVAAAEEVKIPADFRVSITNTPGKNAYPISTFTWIIVHEKNKAETGKILKGLLTWALDDGQKYTADLGFAPLPNNVKEMVKSTISSIQ
jgi:phosphate transport system substrate-binding protein